MNSNIKIKNNKKKVKIEETPVWLESHVELKSKLLLKQDVYFYDWFNIHCLFYIYYLFLLYVVTMYCLSLKSLLVR